MFIFFIFWLQFESSLVNKPDLDCCAVCNMCDSISRKRGLLLNNATGIVGAILMASSKAAQSYEMLIIGRMIIGFNCGNTHNQKIK